jgi:hypothetical protein
MADIDNRNLQNALRDGTLQEVKDALQNYKDNKNLDPTATVKDILEIAPLFLSFKSYVAENPHVDVIEYVIKNGYGSGVRDGEHFLVSVFSTTSNPDIITLFVNQGYDISSEERIQEILDGVAQGQEHPQVVKTVFEEIVKKSGRTEVDILEMRVFDPPSNDTFLQHVVKVSRHVQIIPQVIELYPDRTMRLEKYKRLKQYMESDFSFMKYRLLPEDVTRLLEDVTKALNDLERQDSDVTDSGGRRDDKTVSSSQRWWIVLVVICILTALFTIAAVFLLRQ